jgi:hypothetical protein
VRVLLNIATNLKTPTLTLPFPMGNASIILLIYCNITLKLALPTLDDESTMKYISTAAFGLHAEKIIDADVFI